MSDQQRHERVDADFRRTFDQGDYERTAVQFMSQYGREVAAFVADRVGNDGDASEVFSQFAEDFWRGLPRFAWRTTLRAWAFAVARNAASRHHRSDAKRGSHRPFSDDSMYGIELARVRTRTQKHLRTEVKSRVRRLRERLSEDDQVLLVLRVDQGLSFKELAVAMGGDAELEATEITRRATNLRQRFQQVKRRLRQIAVDEGLLDPSSG
ncbi:MAG: sigma-70 family RNA polymerase sigma factor [Myxococcota bacterium]